MAETSWRNWEVKNGAYATDNSGAVTHWLLVANTHQGAEVRALHYSHRNNAHQQRAKRCGPDPKPLLQSQGDSECLLHRDKCNIPFYSPL